MNIYVGNLSYSLTEDKLRDLFSNYGKVIKVSLIKDRETDRSKGFGFVEMDTPSSAQTAIQELNGKEIDGRTITVNEARPRESNGGGGREQRGGGFGRRNSY
jgi:RNA recognition motif-containing protein